MKTFNLFFTILFLFISFANADVSGTKIQGPALIEGFNEVASSAGTTTLTKDSQTKQILTGSTTHTYVLPSATTLPLSRRFLIINKSTGTATIQTSGGGALTIVSSGLQKEFHLRAAGSAAGTWDILEGGGSGGAWGGITGTLSDQTDLQSALNLKAPLASPTFTGTVTTPATASRALVTGASSELTAATTTATEIGYVNGVTSAIQTQLDAKQARSTLTTKGDLYVATASATTARQAVGSDGLFLKADSSQSTGVVWASASSSALSVVTKTTTYTATTSDDVINVSTASSWTLTLYAASGNSGKVLRVVKTSSDSNPLTVDGNSSETINGFTTIALNFQYDEVTLICDGTGWFIYSQIKAPTVQKFTSGSGTYTTPNAVTYLNVEMVGGGGGGGGSGTSGGTAGGNGSNTTFGSSLLTANYGSGGSTLGAGGAGGTASLGTGPVGTIITGGYGQGSGGSTTASTVITGGSGGNTALGGNGNGGGFSVGSGGNGSTNSGSGGGGGCSPSAGNAGAGGGGGGYINAKITRPTTSYAYAVGSGGSSGTAGTGGAIGGAGGSGYIIVTEFY